MKTKDIMTEHVVTGSRETTRIRRLVVVDQDGFCCGIVSQADIARRIADKAGEVVKEVSQPTGSASAVSPRAEHAEVHH